LDYKIFCFYNWLSNYLTDLGNLGKSKVNSYT